MNTETSSYCCDLLDFDFNLQLIPKTDEELNFMDIKISSDVHG